MIGERGSGSLVLWAAVAVVALAGIRSLVGYARSSSATNGFEVANNTPRFIRHARDLGPTDPTAPVSVTVWLHLQNGPELDRVAAQVYQKGSPSYHRWLNQAQFDAIFSPTAQGVRAVEAFLTAHGMSVVSVAENNLYIEVQGTVGDVEQAFNVAIHNFRWNGATHRSNTSNPMIADPSGMYVAGITGMDDLAFQPDFAWPFGASGAAPAMIPLSSAPSGLFFDSQCFYPPETQTFPPNATPSTVPQATYTGNRYGADITNTTLGQLAPCGYDPSELQTAYNMTPLYAQGLDGTGQTIVITDAFGSPTVQQDVALFSSLYGLPAPNLTVLRAPGAVNVPNLPQSLSSEWALETTLDVEWAHAMAPGANITVVIGPTSSCCLDLQSLPQAINWAVIHRLGDTISNSWNTVEGVANPATLNSINRILEMAAVEGVDVNFASGDEGDFARLVGFKTVGFPASSSFATGVGGTSLALNRDDTIMFQTGWGNNPTRIANRTSQGAVPVIPPLHLGFLYGAGGGSSLFYAKPSFQSSLPGTARLVPDISFLADPNTGVEFIETVSGVPSVGLIGGTSLSTPMFSALMAIAEQKAGGPLGQAAQLVYSLPAGAVTDIVPVGSPNNVTGTNTTSTGTTSLSADQLAAPLFNTTIYLSTLYDNAFAPHWAVFTFGTDSSLTTAVGWDDVTGVGTPNGMNFINAIAP